MAQQAKNPSANVIDVGRSLGEANGHPVQHACLPSPMDRGAKQATAFVVTELDATQQLTQGQVDSSE